ncbi:MAG: phospho-N-acetylmuramoyl-pentapeptide-transferase [Spirochaetales bacterium]|nr:phospho-N-acetylmuramoyl-pentapeptide-transferase [Spirochaetales bacterium]
MVLKYLYPFVKYFTFFNIFQYVTFRAAYAAITALLLSFLLGPWLIVKLRKIKFGQSIRKDGPKTHLAKSGTPTMGGLLIIFSIVVSVLFWQDLNNPFTWILLLTIVGYGFIGFLDDMIKIKRKNSGGLSAGVKFSGQIILSLVIVMILYINRTPTTTMLYIPFIKHPIADLSYLYIPFAVTLLVGTSNAVNLTDGLDGLAIGLVIMVGITFAVLAYVTGHTVLSKYLQIPFVKHSWEITVYCLALVGAAVGFLWFNAHPAEIMMGDTGSLSLGGAIGVVSLIIKKEILLVIIGGVFVMEALSVIIQVTYYKCTKKRVFKMAPIHHHFELLGWPESKVVIRFWILGGLFAILSLSTLKIQ